jgi:hypothetical protein
VDYFFEIAENASFTLGLQQSGWQAGTSYAPALAYGTTYYWHVKARDTAGNETAYTGTWSLTSEPFVNPDTAITAPTAGLTLTSSPYSITGTATQGTDTLQNYRMFRYRLITVQPGIQQQVLLTGHITGHFLQRIM